MKVKTITFQRKVLKEEEGLYLEVPFFVPDQAEAMELSYDYDRNGAIIDFGLLNETGELIGWSGSDRSRIVISDHRSMAGFASVPVAQGQWSILLGAYKVEEEG